MADITKTISLFRGQWSTPDNPNPRLSAPIGADDTTIKVTAPLEDETGAVVTDNFIMTVKSEGYTEAMLVTGVSVDGLTLTVTRGLYLSGLDKTTGNASLAKAHPADSPVACSTDSLHFDMAIKFIRGEIASGSNEMYVGNEDASDIYLYFDNGAGTPPYLKVTTSGMFYAPDGSSESPLGGTGAITVSDGLDLVAGVASVDTSDTTIFVKTSSGASDEDKTPVLGATGKLAEGFIPQLDDLRVNEDVAVTSTSTELNKLDGFTGTAANLNTLTDGSNADALHSHIKGDSVIIDEQISVVSGSADDGVSHMVTAAGNLTAIYVNLTVAPGGATGTTFTVHVNGVASALSIRLDGATTDANDTGTVAVSAGDIIDIRQTNVTGGIASSTATIGVNYIPD